MIEIIIELLILGWLLWRTNTSESPRLSNLNRELDVPHWHYSAGDDDKGILPPNITDNEETESREY